MCQREIESFLQKFYQLQRAGQTAHLDLDTHAGQAWVGLRVQLGHGPGQYMHPHLKKAEGPSRQRRRKKRAAARVAGEATLAAEKTVLTEKSEDITAEVKDQCTEEIVETGIKNTEKVLKEVTDEICADSAYLESPIPQVDGAQEEPDPDQLFYSFVSDYHQDDIKYCLDEELFPAKNASLVSCVAPRPRQSADQLCIVAIRRIAGQEFIWPDMKEDQAPVFRELKRK